MPNTREKLIELCKQANDELRLRQGCSTWGDFADCLIANGVTISNLETVDKEWIPVTEDKPKRIGHYFIAYRFKGDGADMQFFGEAMWHDDIPDNGYVKGNHFSNEGVDGMYVTHWMEIPKLPLPEPPKGE